MNKNKSDWQVPSDWVTMFGLFTIVPATAFLAALLPPVTSANVFGVYLCGLGLGCLGIVLLFFARMPLYRQRQFFTFGPKALPAFHRKLYWLAYVAIVSAILLFAAILLFGMILVRTQ